MSASPSLLAQAADTVDGFQRALTIGLFAVFVIMTLVITLRASRNNSTAADFYSGGRSLTGMQNGVAIGGDYMSAASFLGIAGIIALSGYDGFLYSIGFLVAWLIALLLVAELLRNSGKFTMADVLAFRMRQRPVRIAAGVSTIVVSIFYLLAQMVGAGALVSLLLGVTSDAAKNITIAAVGLLMIFYVTVGGMKGTTWVQIIKAVLLMTGTTFITVLILIKFGGSVSNLLGTAAAESGKGDAFLSPGQRYGTDAQGIAGKLDLLSLGLALVLGTAGLPHILTRFYTVPDSKAARKSVLWAIGIIGSFYLMTIALGFGAAALVGPEAIRAQSGASGNTAAPQLAQVLGEDFFGETGGTILLAAHRGIESITLDRGSMHLKDELMPRYAELIYNGFWFTPEREMLQAAIDHSQAMVTGQVTVKLYKGNVTVIGRTSPYSLYDQDLVTFEEGKVAYDHNDASGFIKLNALRLRVAAKRDKRVKG